MYKRALTYCPISKDFLGEVHEVFKVVNASAGNQIVLTGKSQSLYKVIQQACVDRPVKDKTGCAATLAGFQAFLNLSNDVRADIIIDIQLRIPGHLDDV